MLFTHHTTIYNSIFQLALYCHALYNVPNKSNKSKFICENLIQITTENDNNSLKSKQYRNDVWAQFTIMLVVCTINWPVAV